MNKIAKVVLVIVFTAVILVLVYQQIEIENLKPIESSNLPQPTATLNPTLQPTTYLTAKPTSNPTTRPPPQGYTEVPSTIISTNLDILPQAGVLVISGNVTNISPNILHNVGLHAYSFGYPFIQGGPETLIDITVPIVSGSYPNNQQLTLSTLSPHESVSIVIIISSQYESRTPTLYGNEVTVVQLS